MPLMNVFEPLFLLLVLVTVVTMALVVWRLLTGQSARAWRLGRRLGIGVALYVVVLVVVSIVSPRRVYGVGDPQCFDDWCITVTDARRAPAGGAYWVSLRLTNRARRVPMGEKGTVVYLTDALGRRFDPVPDGSDVPLDSVLLPGTSLVISRRFSLPDDAHDVGLVFTHEGGFPIGWLVISEGGWFAKPPLVHLSS